MSQQGVLGPATRVVSEPLGRTKAWLRRRFQGHREQFGWFRQRLRRAQITTPYDEYLTVLSVVALCGGLVGATIGSAVGWAVLDNGSTGALPLGVAASLWTLGLVVGVLAVGYVGIQYPTVRAWRIRQQVDTMLPQTLIFMYALSRGGLEPYPIIERVVRSEILPGTTRREFERIVRDVEFGGRDLGIALRNCRTETASRGLQRFLGDLQNVLDSGGELSEFLEQETMTFVQQANDRREAYLERLDALNELFLVGFVVAPIFLIVTLVLVGTLGADTLWALDIVIYLVLPVVFAASYLVLRVVAEPFVQPPVDMTAPGDRSATRAGPERDDRIDSYERRMWYERVRNRLHNPIEVFRAHPPLTLLVTLPLVGVGIGIGVAVDAVGVPQSLPPGIEQTITWVVIPFIVTAVPLVVCHELNRRQAWDIQQALPDKLQILSNANRIGIPFTDALVRIATESDGPLGDEFSRTTNDIRWNHDSTAALKRLASRIRVPEIARTIAIIAVARKSTVDMTTVLDIAAEETAERTRSKREQRQALTTYKLMIGIGFAVYLFIIAMLTIGYIQQGGASKAVLGVSQTGSAAPSQGDYRIRLFHSVLIQAVGSGLLIGQLGESDVISGLKYSSILITIAAAVFLII
jgi:flagellar protein FlaJ